VVVGWSMGGRWMVDGGWTNNCLWVLKNSGNRWIPVFDRWILKNHNSWILITLYLHLKVK
jgi:hypothetical protein